MLSTDRQTAAEQAEQDLDMTTQTEQQNETGFGTDPVDPGPDGTALASTLDEIFRPDGNAPRGSGSVTIYRPAEGQCAVYTDGALACSGDAETVLTEAVFLLGGAIHTSADHLLGDPTADPAPDLDAIDAYAADLGRVDILRAQAAALLAEADEVASRLGQRAPAREDEQPEAAAAPGDVEPRSIQVYEIPASAKVVVADQDDDQ